jgi:hypothetical protein
VVRTHIDTVVMTHIDTVVMTHIDTVVRKHIDTVVRKHIDTVVRKHIDTVVMTHIDTVVMTHIRLQPRVVLTSRKKARNLRKYDNDVSFVSKSGWCASMCTVETDKESWKVRERLD